MTDLVQVPTQFEEGQIINEDNSAKDVGLLFIYVEGLIK